MIAVFDLLWLQQHVNFAATMSNLIHVHLKMAPSKDPLPFKVFLGYMSYPTEANHVAMTEMPQQGTTQGNSYFSLVVETQCLLSLNTTT